MTGSESIDASSPVVINTVERKVEDLDSGQDEVISTVDGFKHLMYRNQDVRRACVKALLDGKPVSEDRIVELRKTLAILSDVHTQNFQREMATTSDKFSVNIKDEIIGLQKDLQFLERLASLKMEGDHILELILEKADLATILAPFHPVSEGKFFEELENMCKFLMRFIESEKEYGKKPILITDWDGTMKDYCSQYATNLQPVYSAVGMAAFASRHTRLSAVLTAGPLRGPGILDLTALPIDGPLVFSGSWGREWWLHGKRVAHYDGVSEEGIVALDSLNEEIHALLQSGDYAQFALVGSGVQRKVDRLTLGVQTVCHHVQTDLSSRYQDEVKERMHRVDPLNQILVFDPSTELEVEVCVHKSGTIWNKAHGVARVVETFGDSLATPGRVLICGDTASDLPMVSQAASENPSGVMALFVGQNEKLRDAVRGIISDPERVCFVSCPDVVHAAFAQILVALGKKETEV